MKMKQAINEIKRKYNDMYPFYRGSPGIDKDKKQLIDWLFLAGETLREEKTKLDMTEALVTMIAIALRFIIKHL